MKIYISADIEGVAGICDASEADRLQPADYQPLREQMTAEVQAACEGAFAAGAKAIVVKDAHGSGRNIDPRRMAAVAGREVELIRGWSGHPFAMVQGIDAGFGGAVFVGFHSAAGSGGNPLAHTVSGRMLSRVELNGEPASEFRLYGLAAATVGVPVCFVSGDLALCEEARRRVPGIGTVATFEGVGASVRSMLPAEAVSRIREAVERAVTQAPPAAMEVPREFAFKLTFVRPTDAYARSFYPGARLVAENEVLLETARYLDVLTFLRFAVR